MRNIQTIYILGILSFTTACTGDLLDNSSEVKEESFSENAGSRRKAIKVIFDIAGVFAPAAEIEVRLKNHTDLLIIEQNKKIIHDCLARSTPGSQKYRDCQNTDLITQEEIFPEEFREQLTGEAAQLVVQANRLYLNEPFEIHIHGVSKEDDCTRMQAEASFLLEEGSLQNRFTDQHKRATATLQKGILHVHDLVWTQDRSQCSSPQAQLVGRSTPVSVTVAAASFLAGSELEMRVSQVLPGKSQWQQTPVLQLYHLNVDQVQGDWTVKVPGLNPQKIFRIEIRGIDMDGCSTVLGVFEGIFDDEPVRIDSLIWDTDAQQCF
ncbi:MAG: hypothetical protein OXT67_06215 [Zetaproteobacteria bacterium]|nr:hypothetical protein [Zetaproteobacteria bacterium]